jgi:nitrogenase molybdenum-iron protein alpha chain
MFSKLIDIIVYEGTMNYFERAIPPTRESRLNPCVTFGGTICGLAARKGKGCLESAERSFSQGTICLLIPALAIINSFPQTAVLLHGAAGCGTVTHSQNTVVRMGSAARQGKAREVLWFTTALQEMDVVNGGERKLEQAIREIDRQYSPKFLVVVTTCVPGIIGDDVDTLIEQIRTEISAVILPVHCEGFKTSIWATAYDAVYHTIGRNLLDPPEGEPSTGTNPRLVNLMNISSMGRVDELELERLLGGLDLEVNIFPGFAEPGGMYRATRAALSISTCPTHDDYFFKHLHERYGVPFIIQHMPIGIANTSMWLRDIGRALGLVKEAERIIERETARLHSALEPLLPAFEGKRAFVATGEIRAFATASLLRELGFEIVGVRSFHHDEFAEGEYSKLASEGRDFVVNIADCQPFEEANLLRRLKPDIFMGHVNGNSTAARLGIPTAAVYNAGLHFVGYRGAYEVARRLYRQLRNPAFNRSLGKHVKLRYKEEWYECDPFSYIRLREGASHA